MKSIRILLDVGGTQLKGAVADSSGCLLGEICSVAAHAKESREVIFSTMTELILGLREPFAPCRVEGIGMAFPGPFDYEHGVSRMQGLDKYDSIYGLSIEREIKARAPVLQDVPFDYLHDVEAFAVGESWFGEAKDAGRILCLCIGTGAGSAFVEDRVCLKETAYGVPENGWLYNTPYRDSIIDDYLSVRGLEAHSRKLLGRPCSGKELYALCREGNDRALAVYRAFGEDLLGAMQSFLDSFRPDAVVLGGQISKSFVYFGGAFRTACEARGIRIYTEAETSARAMQGLVVHMKRRTKYAEP